MQLQQNLVKFPEAVMMIKEYKQLTVKEHMHMHIQIKSKYYTVIK